MIEPERLAIARVHCVELVEPVLRLLQRALVDIILHRERPIQLWSVRTHRITITIRLVTGRQQRRRPANLEASTSTHSNRMVSRRSDQSRLNECFPPLHHQRLVAIITCTQMAVTRHPSHHPHIKSITGADAIEW